MATQAEITFTYDDLGELWRLSLGEHVDISCAYYDGDYSKSLEQAQRDKHAWIFQGIEFQPGQRILDIGCGWGPMLVSIKKKGGEGVGLTLSPKQVKACQRDELDVLLRDWKTLQPGELGEFDAVVSLGAFEHFCSVEELLAGKRDEIYEKFFRTCFDLLKEKGTLYLQTMTWGSKLPWGNREPKAEDIDRLSLDAPYKSDERILALIRAFFPGSWIPRNLDNIKNVAEPYFELIECSDGRLDYIQTYTEWDKALFAHKRGKLFALIKLLPKYLFGGRVYRAKIPFMKESAMREVFIRDLFGHQRIFFRKKS